MKSTETDIIVVGAGLLGMSTAAALARTGRQVQVLESQDNIHHNLGSSHGRSRITRTLASETRVFEQLAAESKVLMRKLGALRYDAEALFIVQKYSEIYSEIKSTLRRGLGREPHEFSREEIAERFGVTMRLGEVCFVDQTAGTFDPFIVLETLQEQILAIDGNSISFNTRVSEWKADREGIRVESTEESWRAQTLVIATGGWTPSVLNCGNLCGELKSILADSMKLERIPLFFFTNPGRLRHRDSIQITFLNDGRTDMFSMPDGPPEKKRLKVGFHHSPHPFSNPDAVPRHVSSEEKERAINYMKPLVGSDLIIEDTDVCLYAAARDKDVPLVGLLPTTDNVYLATYGAGTAAKHALALGDALSHLIAGMQPRFDMTVFDPQVRIPNIRNSVSPHSGA